MSSPILPEASGSEASGPEASGARPSSVGPGKVALISGGNRGIGLALCQALAREGTRVYMGCRDPAAGAEVIARKNLSGVIALLLDVAAEGSAERAVARVLDECSGLDALVNNAGISRGVRDRASLESMAQVRDTFDVNFFGALRLSQCALPAMRGRVGAQIVNVSSGHGCIAKIEGNNLGYRASKAALNAMTLSLAHELADEGIRVNAMTPGWVRTRLGGVGAPRSLEEGIDTLLWLLRGGGDHGKLYRDRAEFAW